MEATDMLRMAEALQSKVVIPIHDQVLWDMRKDRATTSSTHSSGGRRPLLSG